MKDIQLDTESAFYKRIKEKQVDVLKSIPAIQNDVISKKESQNASTLVCLSGRGDI